jgi:serine/threonine protein kinase
VTRRLGTYEILGPLGEGGMGVVYRVRHVNLGGEYALKTIPLDSDPEVVARSRREGEAMAQLSGHLNVVSVHTLFEDQGQLCLVMELCPGGDLQSRVQRGPLPPTEAARVVAGLAEGLAAAHEAGILHRDLKPANVLFDAGGVPKLTDFGIARVADSQSLTQTGSLLGTPSYMSPEQAQGRRADARSDVYGLGAILYQCLSGAPPFGPGAILSVLNQVVNEPPPPLPAGVPPILGSLCLQALAKDPADRPQSALDLRDELLAEVGEDAGLRKALRIASGVLVVLILVLVGVLVQRSMSPRDVAGPTASASGTVANSPEVAAPPPSVTPDPLVTPAPSIPPAPSPSSPSPEDPWLLRLPPWPKTPGEKARTRAEVSALSRQVARFPPLSASAWRARGLRTHAAPKPTKRAHLADSPGPDWEFFARAFQDLEQHPTDLACLSAASKGVQNPTLRSANGVRGHADYGRWLLLRAAAAGSDSGFRRLSRSFATIGLDASPLNQASELLRRSWRLPPPPSREVLEAWRRLGAYASERYAEPLRVLLPPDPPLRERPRGPATINRALAELSSRSWDLLFLMESAARREGPDSDRFSAKGARYEKDLVKFVTAAMRGNCDALRELGRRVQEGGMGCIRDEVTGRLLLYLVSEESPKRRKHALYNLGHGSTGESVLAIAKGRSYTREELAFLVLSQPYARTRIALDAYRRLNGKILLPTPAEADLLFLEARARELDAAGLLGREPWAYGGPPALPETAPLERGTSSPAICTHLRAWVPHSLVLRMYAREAAGLPTLEYGTREAVARKLAGGDPLRAAHYLRTALEGDRIAVRRFLDALVYGPVTDPILRARLIIATAFFGTPRILKGFKYALQDLPEEWSGHLDRVLPAGARVYWEAEGLDLAPEGAIGVGDAPPLDEAWQILRAFDAELAREGVLVRLSDWDAAGPWGGEATDRIRRGLERLVARDARLAKILAAEKAAGREGELLRRAAAGDPGAMLELGELWSGQEQRSIARAALAIALEGLPQEEWAGGASLARALFLSEFASSLEGLAKGSTPALWRVFHRERELALLGAGLPSLADLDAWGVPR